MAPDGTPGDFPPTYEALLERTIADERKIAGHIEFLCEIYMVLDGAKGNQERAAAITKVKGAIASLDEVETDG